MNEKAASRTDWQCLDQFSRRTGFRPFFLTPKIEKRPRLSRQNRSFPVIPNHVIGSCDFLFQRHLRFDHFLSRTACNSFAQEQPRQLDAGRTSHHHHPVAQGFTAGFIKKGDISKEKIRSTAMRFHFRAPLAANPRMENLFERASFRSVLEDYGAKPFTFQAAVTRKISRPNSATSSF